MRQGLSGLLPACLLLAGTAPAGADFPEIKARGSLLVLYVAQNTPVPGESPFFAVKDDGPVGFDAEVLRLFCKRHSLRLEVESLPNHDAALAALLAGKGDVLAGNITATEQRRKLVEFTVEVLPTRYIVVSRKPHAAIHSLALLRAARVGTTRGTSRHEATLAAGVPAANIDDSVPMDRLDEALRSGRVSAAILEAYAAVSFQRRDPELQLGMFLGPAQSLAYAVRRREPLLLRALNEHVASARSSPAWQQLVTKHFGAMGNDMLTKVRERE